MNSHATRRSSRFITNRVRQARGRGQLARWLGLEAQATSCSIFSLRTADHSEMLGSLDWSVARRTTGSWPGRSKKCLATLPEPLASLEGRLQSGARGAALQIDPRPFNGSGTLAVAAFGVRRLQAPLSIVTEKRGSTTALVGSVRCPRVPEPLASFDERP